MTTGDPTANILVYPHLGSVPTARDEAVASRVFGTKELVPANAEQHGHVLKSVCELCAEKGIVNIPPVLVAKSSVKNASMTGGGTMIISDGLVETLNETEMRAIIMHELEHYRKKEVTSTIGHAIGFLADLVVGIFGGKPFENFVSKRVSNHAVQSIITHAVPALGTHYLVFAPTHAYFQRKSEYQADLEGAKTVGFDNMIGVLKYFDELYENKHKQVPTSIVTRIMNKGMLENVTDILFPFEDHPTFKDRIANLENEQRKQPVTRVSAIEQEQIKQNAPGSPAIH